MKRMAPKLFCTTLLILLVTAALHVGSSKAVPQITYGYTCLSYIPASGANTRAATSKASWPSRTTPERSASSPICPAIPLPSPRWKSAVPLPAETTPIPAPRGPSARCPSTSVSPCRKTRLLTRTVVATCHPKCSEGSAFRFSNCGFLIFICPDLISSPAILSPCHRPPSSAPYTPPPNLSSPSTTTTPPNCPH
jgi:hypothetical protein